MDSAQQEAILKCVLTCRLGLHGMMGSQRSSRFTRDSEALLTRQQHTPTRIYKRQALMKTQSNETSGNKLNIPTTGVDLSKILGGQTKILAGKGDKSDACMGVYQLLGARARAAPPPKFYAYDSDN